MKILIKNGRFTGGASLSMLEYAKVLKKEKGIEVISVGEFMGKNEERYRKSDIKLYNLPNVRINNPVFNIILILRYMKIIKKENPNLIINGNPYDSYFGKIIRDVTNIPTVNVVPGGEVPSGYSTWMKDENVICFSEENKAALTESGYNDKFIKCIPNRMSFIKKLPSKNIYDQPWKENINALLISRLDKDKINSVYKVIDLIDEVRSNHNITLTVVGGGEFIDEIKQYSNKLNEKKRQNFINILGYQKDVISFILNSHIVFGKGRSIIDALYYKRISYVINENKEVQIVKPSNIKELSKYNLSGRNLNRNSENILADISEIEDLPQFLNENSEYVYQNYSIESIESDLVKFLVNKSYSKNIYNRSSNSSSIVILKVIKMYMQLLKKKLYN